MNVIRSILTVVLLMFASLTMAQEPMVEVEFEQSEAIPGQSLTLRVNVLVPTWLPEPVVFPSFEAPNLRIRTPEGSTGPISRTIEGETWSGVSRRLQVVPMLSGTFEIPAQELVITWAEPGKPDPIVTNATLDPITITGVIPEGAEGLDPFIAAETLELTSEVSDVTMPMNAGDSVTLSVVAKLGGTSPFALPDLIPEIAIDGLAVYPVEPVLEEKEDRGKLSGIRTEEVTLVAETGGSGRVPDVSLQWYNLKSKTVETATVEGMDITIDAPAASAGESGQSYRLIVLLIGAALVVLGVAFLLYRRISPHVQAWREARRRRIEASEPYAFAKLSQAVEAKDMGQTLQMLALWAARMPQDPRPRDPLQSALSDLGTALYGSTAHPEEAAWRALNSAIKETRKAVLDRPTIAPALPPLNPTGTHV